MSLCRCLECGRLFKEENLLFIEEDRGEFWGRPVTETMTYSPCCEGDYEDYEPETDTWICESCGNIYDIYDLEEEIEEIDDTECEVHYCCPSCMGEMKPYVE